MHNTALMSLHFKRSDKFQVVKVCFSSVPMVIFSVWLREECVEIEEQYN